MTKKNTFAAAHFHDEEAARAWFEAARWPNGPVCPHCKGDKHYATKKAGRYRCAAKDCRKDFTVMTGTVMERSHAKLTQWAAAFHMGASSKKGFSAHQLHRELGCQYNTAWFLHHRVMEAMRRGDLDLPPMGGEGQIVEADETYYGRAKEKNLLKPRTYPYTKKGWKDKGAARPIIALVERGGKIRTWHVAHADKFTVAKIVSDNIAKESRLHTDESRLYTTIGATFAAHDTVHHSSGEYVREDVTHNDDGEIVNVVKVHTNSAEGFFSIFKRGMRGVYQHCSEKHLHRYLAEFDFRYNYRVALGYNDDDRTLAAIRGGEGKRLTYHQPD
jgi:transposase-like protein